MHTTVPCSQLWSATNTWDSPAGQEGCTGMPCFGNYKIQKCDTKWKEQPQGSVTADCLPTPSQAILSTFSATFLNDRRFFQTPFEHLSQEPALLDLCFLLVGGILLLEYAANLFSTCLSTISNFEDLHSSQQPSVRYSRSSSNKALPSLLTLVKLLCVFSSITSFSC